jgi:hypothetical protein
MKPRFEALLLLTGLAGGSRVGSPHERSYWDSPLGFRPVPGPFSIQGNGAGGIAPVTPGDQLGTEA